MNMTHNTKTRRLAAALAVAATVMVPAALFAGAGTAVAGPVGDSEDDYWSDINNLPQPEVPTEEEIETSYHWTEPDTVDPPWWNDAQPGGPGYWGDRPVPPDFR